MEEVEEWRSSITLPEYDVSSFGRVRRKRWKHTNGRIYGGKTWYGVWQADERRFILQYHRKTYRVAPLVCEAFNGPKPFSDAVVMHDDENSRNNRADNLKWGTQKENLNYPGFKSYASKACVFKMAGAPVPF